MTTTNENKQLAELRLTRGGYSRGRAAVAGQRPAAGKRLRAESGISGVAKFDGQGILHGAVIYIHRYIGVPE